MENKNTTQIVAFRNDTDVAQFLNKNYLTQIKNFFSDEKKALKFLSSVRADIQRNPKLLECEPRSLVNAYMMMAQCGFMPSQVSSESYVLPFNNSKKNGNEWIKVTEAQFQVGYQGFVTLFYQSGVEKIYSDIVRKNDKFTFVNGNMTHEVDLTLSNEERGEAIGAYVTITFRGEANTRYMNAKDIIAHAKKFSKSYDPVGKYSPWNPANDPELNMYRKTVLKQFAKFLPKNEIINKAIELDTLSDSKLMDRYQTVAVESESLKMKNLLTYEESKKEGGQKEEDYSQEVADTTESVNIE